MSLARYDRISLSDELTELTTSGDLRAGSEGDPLFAEG